MITAVWFSASSYAQIETSISNGYCGNDLKWSFDGYTLSIINESSKLAQIEMNDYDMKNVSPWVKKKLEVKRVRIGKGVKNIGSCAFANCKTLLEVVFEGTDVTSIGWAAFMNCSHLRTISIPSYVKNIETVAFANCSSLTSVTIPSQCRVEDQAFVSCNNLQSIDISPNAILGHYVFVNEMNINGAVRHSLYTGEIRRIPSYVNSGNCREYGIAKSAMEKCVSHGAAEENYDFATSDIDSIVPPTSYVRNNTYALIIGNQNYRFVPDVPYAIHDARTFATYCQKTLGIPVENIHVCEDATKEMIIEDEFEWVQNIRDRNSSHLIVYYAGHGVPDINDKNKAYILPTDVRGTKPNKGIALNDFYSKLGDLAFEQTSVFLDACFSGINRDNSSVNEGMRAVEVQAEEGKIGTGSVVVFAAAQGNETAQGYTEQGHGLFTYYLLKEIQSTGGTVTFGALSDNIKDNVTRTAPQLKLRKTQTPTTNASDKVNDSWRDMQF